MKLLEFFNFSPESNTNVNDNRYDASKDTSVLKKSDTRKMRLTLEQINTLRKQSEMHEQIHHPCRLQHTMLLNDQVKLQ